MPRPGPRPYECVKQVWHSDRHQPMRGSIIQQIFRVVHESHSAATKKNREWQEKLPIVVLKAEEIMYSKANSETEYMDLQTLWDRANDAINTIIRRDESTETGKLLPPCVEAALNLGCVPVRASRSQRHSNPQCYLSPRTQESACVPSRTSDNTTIERSPNSFPLHSGNRLTFSRPVTMSSTHLVPESNKIVRQDNIFTTASCNISSSYDSPPISSQFIRVESNTSLNVGSVYPLYYGTHFQAGASKIGCQSPQNSNTIIVGTPIFPSTVLPAETDCLQNLSSCDGNTNALNRFTHADFSGIHEKEPEMQCDLSLRLGQSLGTCTSGEKGLSCNIDDVGYSGCQVEGKFGDLYPSQNKEFSFFPVKAANHPFEFGTSTWNSEVEGQNVEAAVRKSKAPFNNNVEDGQFFRRPEPSSNHFISQIKRPGW